jgi:hypothetical protein
VDQITERVSDRAGNQHGGERLFGSILTDVLSRPRTLVVEIARHLTGLWRSALDKLARTVHRLPAGLGGAIGQVLDRSLGLVERRLHLLSDTLGSVIYRVADLFGRVFCNLSSP